MKKMSTSKWTILFFLVFTLQISTLNAQISKSGMPASKIYQLQDVQATLNATPMNFNLQLWQADAAQRAVLHLPAKAGISVDVNKSIDNSGEWSQLANGDMVWRLKLEALGAKALGVVFDQFYLPEGSELFIYDENKTFIIGAFTSENNNPSNVFSTHIIPGTKVVIEYIEHPEGTNKGQLKHSAIINGKIVGASVQSKPTINPADYKSNALLNIGSLIYVINEPVMDQSKDLGDAASCQVNINCSPEGDTWQVQKRGVARILFKEGTGWYYCTGTLVNNTSQNTVPYFLTAYHCGGVASAADHTAWQFYFNYERATCANTGTPVNNMLTGCTKRAEGGISGGTDMQLLELTTTPPLTWNPYYNGWDRSGTASTSGAAIHHPSGDAKKISSYTSALTTGTWNDGTNVGLTNGHWKVSWAATTNGFGVSEGGSSGSPIFDYNHRVVGTLTGGSSSCTATSNQDLYGKFSIHWENAANGATNAYKLRPWLDPAGTNPTTLNGYDPNAVTTPPVADFVADRTTIVAGETINFTDLSTNAATSWSWTFAGGSPATSTQRNVPVMFVTPGTYTVTLIATNAYGSNTKTRTSYITVTSYVQATTNPITIGTGTTGAAYPLGVVRAYERSAAIYTAAEVTRSGYIDSIAYQTGSSRGYRPIKVYLKHTTATTLTASTWATMIDGAVLVYDDSLQTLAGGVWIKLACKLNNFYYNGTSNLLVLVEQNKNLNSNQSSLCRYTTATSKHQTWKSAATPIAIPTGTGTIDNNRPNIQITFKVFTVPVADFVANSYPSIMQQGFDSTWLPSGWSVINTHATERWQQGNPSTSNFSTIDPGNVSSAIVPWIAEAQDEWIISPVINTTAYATRPMKIKFYVGFGRSWLSPGATLKFKISTNNGTTWTDLWNAIGDATEPAGTSWAWRLIDINLATYAGQSVKFAWEYVGNDGDMMGLDGINLYVAEPPTQVNIFEGESLGFLDLSTGNPMTWNYSFAGGTPTTATAKNPTIQYNTAGIYNAALTVVNPLGTNTKTRTSYVVVTGRAPIANFEGFGNLKSNTGNPFIPVGGNVRFNDLSSRVPTSWSWSFPSALPLTSTTQNPTNIIYPTAGIYNVSLQATNLSGSNSVTDTGCVFVNGTHYVTNLLDIDAPTVYTLGTTPGKLPGHNGDTIKKYAEFFSNAYEGDITKVRIAIDSAKGVGKTVNIVVWDGSTGSPGTVIKTQTFSIPTFAQTSWDTITFTTPAHVTGNFFVGYEITYDAAHNYYTHMFCPYMAVDRGSNYPNSAWMYVGSTWATIDDAFGGFKTALYIQPEFTYYSNVPIVSAIATPGCASGSVTITSSITANQTFHLLDNAGTSLQNWTGNTNTHTFTGLANGTYKGKTVNGAVTSAISAAVTLTNDVATVAGTVTGGTTVCIGSTSGILTLAGYTGNIVRWESSVSPFTTWTPITNTSATYTSGVLSQTTQFRAVVQNGSCANANSVFTTVTISPLTVAGTVTGGTTICTGSTSGILTLAGYTGNIVRWESSVSPFTTWTPITNTSATYTSGVLSQTTQFRAVVQSGSCANANSVFTTVTISPLTVAGTVTGGTTICTGITSGILTLAGYTGNIVRWESSVSPFTTWTPITNTSATYTSGVLSQTTQFRAVVQSGSCATDNSVFTTVTISPLTVAGTVTGGTTVCTGSTSGILTLAGYTGNIVRWESSVSPFTTWTPITNTSATYTSGVLSQTTQFRAVVQSGSCANANSVFTTVTISPLTVAGTVTGGTTICSGSTSGILTLAGYTGNIVRWESSISPYSTWTPITNTSAIYTSGALSQTTQFRAVVQSGSCATANSVSTIVTVDPTTIGGAVSAGVTQIYLGESTGTISLTGQTGAIVKWQKRLGAGTWIDIVNNSATYSEIPNAIGLWEYRAVVQSGSCLVANSASVIIEVLASNAGAVTGGLTSICLGSSTGTLTLGSYVGTIVKWQKRLNSGTWVDISNITTIYAETPLSAGTWEYRAVVNSGTDLYSAPMVIIVNSTSVGGSVTGGTTICNGSISALLSLTGNVGTVVKWQSSISPFTSWIDISNTALTYTSGTLSQTTKFRAVVQSGVCTAVNSVETTVIVDPTTVGGDVNGGTAVCNGITSGLLTLSGNIGTVVKWQSSISPYTSWTDISNTALTYTSGALTQTTQFRAVVQSGSCGIVNSNSTTVTVTPALVGGSLAAGVTQIYLGQPTGLITLTGNSGTILKWQKRLGTGGAWTDIVNTSATYSEIPTSVGLWEYCAVIQDGSCGPINSATVIIEVLAVNVGTVTGGTTPICLGNSTGTLTLSGYTGTIVKWQKRVDLGAWIDISNILSTYSEIPTTVGSWEYRAVVSSGTDQYSSSVTIVVTPATIGGVVSSSIAVCTGSTSGLLSLTGNIGNVVKWQSSVNPFSTWLDISNTSTSYTSGVLIQTTQFRAVVQNGSCGIENSTPAVIQVDQMPTAAFTYTSTDLSVVFVNQSTNATSYSWVFGSGSSTSLETSPTFVYPAPGQYTVILNAFNGQCMATSTQIITVTSVKVEEQTSQSMSVYPIPTTGKITIQFGSKVLENTLLSVFDIAGKVVYSKSVTDLNSNNSLELDFSSLVSGVYHIRIKDNATVMNKVIIIER